MTEVQKRYKWLRLKDDFFGDKVIKKLRKLAGGDTYVIIYLKLQLLSIKNEGKLFFDGVEESFEEELALDIGEDVENVKVTVAYLERNNLLECTFSDEYLLPGVLGLIGSESESAERVRRHRENKKSALLQCNEDVTECNIGFVTSNTDIDIEKDIEKDIKKHIVEVFEKLWALYPNKKGKGQISESKKKVIFKIGFDEMSRAVTRYKNDLEKESWRKAQNGSTFFSSGYIDYLDANYSVSEVRPVVKDQPKSANKFNQFPQRQYSAADYAELEKKLLNKNPLGGNANGEDEEV